MNSEECCDAIHRETVRRTEPISIQKWIDSEFCGGHNSFTLDWKVEKPSIK